jgi:hypothetical protein
VFTIPFRRIRTTSATSTISSYEAEIARLREEVSDFQSTLEEANKNISSILHIRLRTIRHSLIHAIGCSLTSSPTSSKSTRRTRRTLSSSTSSTTTNRSRKDTNSTIRVIALKTTGKMASSTYPRIVPLVPSFKTNRGTLPRIQRRDSH